MHVFQIEKLYVEVLYTIANTVGASTGQYAHYKEDLYGYAQEAFGIPQDQHRRYLDIASKEKVGFDSDLRFIFIIFSFQSFYVRNFIFFSYTLMKNIFYETSNLILKQK